MAKNNLADLSTTAASNTDILGQSTAGTALASTLDSIVQNVLAVLARFYDDFGGTGTVGGTADAITLVSGSVFQSLASGNVVAFKAGSANTGAATINVDSLGVKAIRKQGDSALAANDMLANGVYLLRYDTSYNAAAGAWILLNPAGQSSAASTTVAGIIEIATAAEFRTGTDTTRGLGVAETWGTSAEVTLTDAATIAVDGSTFFDAVVTLGGNRTLGTWSNAKAGQKGRIRVVQDGTGSRTLAYHADYEWGGGTAVVLSTAAAAQDLIYYDVIASGRIFLSASSATKAIA